MHLEQHINHCCLCNLPELRPLQAPPGTPCQTFSSTARRRLRFARKTGPPSPLLSLWPTLCVLQSGLREHRWRLILSLLLHITVQTSRDHSWSQTQLSWTVKEVHAVVLERLFVSPLHSLCFSAYVVVRAVLSSVLAWHRKKTWMVSCLSVYDSISARHQF